MRAHGSFDTAREAFERYAELEPRLRPLWDLCRRAAPPVPAPDEVGSDDAYDSDPFEDDPAIAPTDDGWCAEDYFHDHVKSRLLLLVGLYRAEGPAELQSHLAFEEVHDLLLDWALHRPCACCRSEGQATDDDRDAEHVAQVP